MKARITCGPDSAHLALDIASMDDASLALMVASSTDGANLPNKGV